MSEKSFDSHTAKSSDVDNEEAIGVCKEVM